MCTVQQAQWSVARSNAVTLLPIKKRDNLPSCISKVRRALRDDTTIKKATQDLVDVLCCEGLGIPSVKVRVFDHGTREGHLGLLHFCELQRNENPVSLWLDVYRFAAGRRRLTTDAFLSVVLHEITHHADINHDSLCLWTTEHTRGFYSRYRCLVTELGIAKTLVKVACD